MQRYMRLSVREAVRTEYIDSVTAYGWIPVKLVHRSTTPNFRTASPNPLSVLSRPSQPSATPSACHLINSMLLRVGYTQHSLTV